MDRHELTRLADELRALPARTPEPMDVPASWFRRDDGTWSPVYPDGMVGEPFSFAQMIAAKGEDIGTLLAALVDTGLVIDARQTGTELFKGPPPGAEVAPNCGVEHVASCGCASSVNPQGAQGWQGEFVEWTETP